MAVLGRRMACDKKEILQSQAPPQRAEWLDGGEALLSFALLLFVLLLASWSSSWKSKRSGSHFDFAAAAAEREQAGIGAGTAGSRMRRQHEFKPALLADLPANHAKR